MKYPILLPNIFNYPFTYESNLDLKIGEYVSVPFGKNKLTGEVWDKLEENEQKKFKLKKVFKKLKVKPIKKTTINNFHRGPLAQLVEQFPFKEWVVGSSPTGLTT